MQHFGNYSKASFVLKLRFNFDIKVVFVSNYLSRIYTHLIWSSWILRFDNWCFNWWQLLNLLWLSRCSISKMKPMASFVSTLKFNHHLILITLMSKLYLHHITLVDLVLLGKKSQVLITNWNYRNRFDISDNVHTLNKHPPNLKQSTWIWHFCDFLHLNKNKMAIELNWIIPDLHFCKKK